MVSSRISSKPQLNLKRSKVSLQKIAPSSNISLEKRISVLELNVALLAKSINKEADLERKAQRDYEKDVKKQEEKKLRSGEEKQLEKKLSKSILSPVEKEGKRAGGILGKLKDFFMLLLGGWLTNRGFAALKAYAEGDTEQLNSIALEVGKTLAIVGGIFLALNIGILGIVNTIGKIALAITLAPFRFAFNKIRDFFKGRQQSTPKPNASNVKPPTSTGNRTPAGAPGANRPSLGGRPGSSGYYDSAVRSSLSSADKIAQSKGLINHSQKRVDAFKAIRQLLSSGKSKVFNGVKAILRSPGFNTFLGGALKIAFIASTIKNRLDQGFSPMKAILPVIPEILFTLKGAAIGGGLAGALGLTTGPGALLIGLAGAAGGGFLGGLIGEQFTRMLDPAYDTMNLDKVFGFANDPISNALQNAGLIPKTEKTPPRKNPAVSGNMPASSPSASPPNKPAAKVSNSTGTVSTPPAPAPGGGNTTVVYKKVRGAGAGMQGQPLKTGSATDVPLIASANPSNFYTMYSQLLYNVVT